jgi:hypothetical protein
VQRCVVGGVQLHERIGIHDDLCLDGCCRYAVTATAQRQPGSVSARKNECALRLSAIALRTRIEIRSGKSQVPRRAMEAALVIDREIANPLICRIKDRERECSSARQ